MRRTLHFVLLLGAVLFLIACRSSRSASESVSVDSLSQSSKTAVDVASTEHSRTVEQDSSDMYVWTVTTEYDTSKADSTGKAPVLRQTKSLSVKRSGRRKQNEKSKNENISATKEESATQVNKSNNKRERVKAETKQPLYCAYIIYGVALVILMAVLAYWVFTKYRAARPQTDK